MSNEQLARRIVGVDPDTHGGIATILRPNTPPVLAPMPIVSQSSHSPLGLDLHEMRWELEDADAVYVEYVPGGSRDVVRIQTAVVTVCSCLAVRCCTVDPQRWRGYWGIGTGEDANRRSVEIARSRWPRWDWPPGQHGLATAALIAEYGLHRELKAARKRHEQETGS